MHTGKCTRKTEYETFPSQASSREFGQRPSVPVNVETASSRATPDEVIERLNAVVFFRSLASGLNEEFRYRYTNQS